MSLDAASDRLRGKQVAITGRLASMTQEEAYDLVARLGGETSRMPNRRTAFLVIGEEGWPFQEDGRITEGLERAKRLQDEGSPLEVVSEQRFLEMIGLVGEDARLELSRLYTTAQLSRILKVPGRRIRSWVRRGLIRPVRSVHRLDYFDFRQVTELRMLSRLTEAGVHIDEIRKSLEQLRRWLPEAENSLARLARMQDEGQLLVRLEDGRLAEPSGQLRLAFETQSTIHEKVIRAPSTRAIPSDEQLEDPFERAIALEDADRLDEAVEAYEHALEDEPLAETAFNLGNALHALGRTHEALKRFRRAVEIDSDYPEAWNNLASVYSDLGQWDRAVEAGERALALAPDYPDAHYNLAHALHACGRNKEAREHGRAYLQHDPHSEWARRLRLTIGIA